MTKSELTVLRDLRDQLLTDSTKTDYWTSDRLVLYDRWFATRIGWKWDYVLKELEIGSENLHVIDWGCGSGVASRKFLQWLGRPVTYQCVDRSALAVESTRASLQNMPGITLVEGEIRWTNALVIVSHVISELSATHLSILVKALRLAQMIIWVEPGDSRSASRLVQVRENLDLTHKAVAPCTHVKKCPLVNAKEWCHFFAGVPAEVFQSAEWGQFGKNLGIDLRSLPVSYLILKRDGVPPSGGRIIGRPRLRSGHALVAVCDGTGVNQRTVTRKTDPDLLKALKDPNFRTIP